MKNKSLLMVFAALFFIAESDISFCQFTIDDPYDKKKKPTEVSKSVTAIPTDKINIGFAYGERFSPSQKFYSGLANLQDAIKRQANLEISITSKVILGSDKIFDCPVLFFCPQDNFDLSDTEKANLKKYLESGGFVILDSFPKAETSETKTGSSLRQMIIDTMGSGAHFAKLPNNHEIYSIVNSFEDGPPIGAETATNVDKSYTRTFPNQTNDNKDPLPEIKGYLEGIYIGSRLTGIFSQKGYSSLWCLTTGNEAQLKMGVNLIVYTFEQPEGVLLKSVAVK